MASDKSLNYAKSLILKLKGDPNDYILDEKLPGGYNTELSKFIDGMKRGELMNLDEWNSYAERVLRDEPAQVEPTTGYNPTSFESEVKSINSIFLREFVTKVLDKAPPYFYSVPASSTGKYHPEYCLGVGGLVRHTKAAVKIALTLFDNTVIAKYNRDEKDIILTALILHDTCKHGLIKSEYTVHEHPLLVRRLSESIIMSSTSENQSSILDRVFSCIESHMGPWTTNNYSKIILPEPLDKLERFVHMADYLASRKFLEVKF